MHYTVQYLDVNKHFQLFKIEMKERRATVYIITYSTYDRKRHITSPLKKQYCVVDYDTVR